MLVHVEGRHVVAGFADNLGRNASDQDTGIANNLRSERRVGEKANPKWRKGHNLCNTVIALF